MFENGLERITAVIIITKFAENNVVLQITHKNNEKNKINIKHGFSYVVYNIVIRRKVLKSMFHTKSGS